ncbi:unnamed protein product [Notodromas monacha]|uniref:Uncharacterized protein n=1 Tax=Notodromas monacha TaxID=399045 RepID=A0A7R9BEY6_9CRUS|nr:unnamed protein product [Notodromas monacha]CAG0914142.1 unnamed protein product [Notodromas monacha]
MGFITEKYLRNIMRGRHTSATKLRNTPELFGYRLSHRLAEPRDDYTKAAHEVIREKPPGFVPAELSSSTGCASFDACGGLCVYESDWEENPISGSFYRSLSVFPGSFSGVKVSTVHDVMPRPVTLETKFGGNTEKKFMTAMSGGKRYRVARRQLSTVYKQRVLSAADSLAEHVAFTEESRRYPSAVVPGAKTSTGTGTSTDTGTGTGSKATRQGIRKKRKKRSNAGTHVLAPMSPVRPREARKHAACRIAARHSFFFFWCRLSTLVVIVAHLLSVDDFDRNDVSFVLWSGHTRDPRSTRNGFVEIYSTPSSVFTLIVTFLIPPFRRQQEQTETELFFVGECQYILSLSKVSQERELLVQTNSAIRKVRRG